jgi:TfoX/Sxy family transcriptional regulator of competence genes
MASDQSFVEFIVEQIEPAGTVTYRKMFGEYGLYVDGKIVGLVCDNRLFLKPTEGGRALMGQVVEAPPYPGAKLSFLIEDGLEDRDWLSALFKVTAQELPDPKPNARKKEGKSAGPKPKRPAKQ